MYEFTGVEVVQVEGEARSVPIKPLVKIGAGRFTDDEYRAAVKRHVDSLGDSGATVAGVMRDLEERGMYVKLDGTQEDLPLAEGEEG